MASTSPSRWRHAWGSVRAQTTIVATVVVGFALVVGSLLLMAALRHALVEDQDRLSLTRAADLARLAEQGDLPPTVTNIGDDGVAQVVTASGRVLVASSGLAGKGPISTVEAPEGEFARLTLHNVPDDDETEDYRVWTTTVDTDDGPTRVYVGQSLESVSEAVGALRNALVIGVPVLLMLVALTTRALVGRALKPVDAMRAEVAAISVGALDRRVPVPPRSDEIARLARTMNQMLDRIEDSQQRQREFVADASHELQSPLASIRLQLEVALAQIDHVEWRQRAEDLLADSDRMERLVRDLLFLATRDSGVVTPTPVLLDLDVLVLEESARLRRSAQPVINTAAVSAAPLRGQPDDIRRLVRNLLENAVTHARSRVVVACSVEDGVVGFTVDDDGEGIAPADRERVFERFVRLDDSRSPAQSGTALGLSIARSIALAHDGSIAIEDPPGRGLSVRFAVRLPTG